MSDIICADDINNERLYELFKAAYMKPEYDSTGDIKIEGPSGFHQIVSVDADKKLIKFMSIFGFKDDRERKEKIELLSILTRIIHDSGLD